MKATTLKCNGKNVKELSLAELIKIEGGHTPFPLPDPPPPFRFPPYKKILSCVPPFRRVVHTPVKWKF